MFDLHRTNENLLRSSTKKARTYSFYLRTFGLNKKNLIFDNFNYLVS